MTKEELQDKLQSILSKPIALPDDSIAVSTAPLVPPKTLDNLTDYVWDLLRKDAA